MAEKQSKDLRPVKLMGLQDEMYPRFNFLKQRLLSIYPRFKTVIEKEKVDESVMDGKQSMKILTDHVDPLKDTVEIILMGSHTVVIKEHETWNSFIASSRCRFEDNEILTKQSLAENVFELDEMKKIATRPCVIVYIVPSEENIKESFEEVKMYMRKRIPVAGHKSFILCSDRFETYTTLQGFIDEGLCESTHNTVGKLVQACLEEKVVAVLQEIVTFTQKCVSPSVAVSDIKRKETLKNAVFWPLQQLVNEIKGGSDEESTEIQVLINTIEDKICKNLSLRCGVNEKLIKNVYAKLTLGKIFKQDLKSIHARKEAKCWEGYIEKINGYLKEFESKILEISEKILTIDFEIKGVFRQSQYRDETKGKICQAKVSSSPYLSEFDQTRILGINGVYGCGVMLGKLVVHIKEYSPADVEDVTKKVIKILMDSESKHFVNRLEVKRIRLSPSANVTYESGQFLRVKNPAGHATDYTYGTLGCFVKGKNNADSSEQLYALSCAHVFPDGCNPVINISRAHPPSSWESIGNFNPEFKLLRERKFDITAIAVLPVAKEYCNHCLKNSNGCDIWKSTIHEGDVRDILGFQVYKWGVSDCTRGIIISVNYVSEDFNSHLNVFIKKQTESSENFSSRGDSGSAVCFDEPTEETVHILSLVNGEMTNTATETHECSYSVHLQKNLDKLSEQCGHSFEPYNLD